MIKNIYHLAGAAVLAASAALPFTITTTAHALPIAECIAPADPGGGWDFTCRSVGKILHDLQLTDSPVQVTNMPGGVGAVAFANVAGNRADDSNLLVATSTVGTTQIAQGRYPAGIDTMRWVGMLGSDVGVLLVNKDSEISDVKAFIEALKNDPGSMAIAGSSGVGGWDHIRALMLAREGGVPDDQLANIRWVQFDGGGPAVTQMMGNHVSAVVTDLGEIAGFIESGDVRVLAVLSEESLPEPFSELPTAREQGLNVIGYNWRGFYTGGDVSDEDYNQMVDDLKQLFDSEAWQETAKNNGLVPIWRGGEEFSDFVVESVNSMAEISREIGVIE